MVKITLYLSSMILLVACIENKSTDTETIKKLDSVVTTYAVDTVEKIAIKEFYDGVEFKNLYQKKWKGESEGNPEWDNKIVTIEGKVYVNSVITRLHDDGSETRKGKIDFRNEEYKNIFRMDYTFEFDPAKISELKKIKKATIIKIKGKVSKQEIYIEPKETYSVIVFDDCEVVN